MVNTPTFYSILWSFYFIFVSFEKKRFDCFFLGFRTVLNKKQNGDLLASTFAKKNKQKARSQNTLLNLEVLSAFKSCISYRKCILARFLSEEKSRTIFLIPSLDTPCFSLPLTQKQLLCLKKRVGQRKEIGMAINT